MRRILHTARTTSGTARRRRNRGKPDLIFAPFCAIIKDSLSDRSIPQKATHYNIFAMPVPRFLQSVLWSYELSKMNAKRHASTIIPQILNYGTWRQVQWVLRTYHKDTIKKYIKHPARGMWRKDSLTYWTSIYNVRPVRREYDRALFSLTPTYLLPEKLWGKEK